MGDVDVVFMFVVLFWVYTHSGQTDDAWPPVGIEPTTFKC